jgi:hypothetical protein
LPRCGGRGRDPAWCGQLTDRCSNRKDAAEVSVFDAAAVYFERDDLGVVHEAVDHGGDDVVAEDLTAAPEGLVGGVHQAGALVA